MKNQKLSIYLIKDDITDHIDIVKDTNSKEIFGDGVLYYKKSNSNPPSWAANFFTRSIDGLVNSSASGLYITKVAYGGRDIFFGLSFGHGWQMFKDGVVVEQFGIKAALSLIRDEIKKIEKKSFKDGLKDVSEQLGKIGSVADFGFDVEQDIMRAVVGEPKNQEIYGKNIIGKDALSLSIKRDVDEISELLIELYKAYESDDYKDKFDWFDKFSTVRDKLLVSNLDSLITGAMSHDGTEGVIYWLSIPEVIAWENTKCFQYSQRSNAEEFQDIAFEDFRSFLGEAEQVTLETLKSKRAFQKDVNDVTINSWSIYSCLYAEVDFDNEKYLLVSGKYYKVNKDFKEKVESEFSVDTSVTLPDWDTAKRENEYNSATAAADAAYQCLDGGVSQRNLIGKGKIEFADLVRSDKYLIHVKKYGSAAVFSHLFGQGLVSARLLLTDNSFRTEVLSKLNDSHKAVVVDGVEPDPRNYTIVYAVGTTKDVFKLPFFSLVNYRNAKEQLRLYGYNVLLIKIQQV